MGSEHSVRKDTQCEHIYPEGDPGERDGTRCRAHKIRGSRFCTYHQPKKEKMLENLARAREILSEQRERQDFRSCNQCSHSETCKLYEQDKINCDYFEMHKALPKLNLNDLQSIKAVEEEIVRRMVSHLEVLDQMIKTDPDPEVIAQYSRIAKRLSSINKDWATINDLFKKRQKAPDFLTALSMNKDDWK